MKDILVVAHFCGDFDGRGNNRFNDLAARFAKIGRVELVTTDFSHFRKQRRAPKKAHEYKVTMLPEPGYQKNASPKRFYSHYVFGRNVRRYLKNRKKPDVIYCAVPSLDAAHATARYAKRHRIRLVIDVQDLWPEAFEMVFNIPVVSALLYRPMARKADRIYACADDVVAVSETYAKRALSVHPRCEKAHSVYLGTDLPRFDRLAAQYRCAGKPKDEIWIAYIGTLGRSYDLICVMDALRILHENGIGNLTFIVMGDGPLTSKFETYAKNKDIRATFTGRLDYGKMAGMLTMCDIAVNPIVKNSAGSIINKVCDYAAASLPVVSTQECAEYADLLEKYEAGFTCKNGDSSDVADKLRILAGDRALARRMGKNSRLLAETHFDRERTYGIIENLVLEGFNEPIV